MVNDSSPSFVFRYGEAFARNIGWVTAAEQESLRHKKIAIAGMGGVGGVHLLTLARLGIGAFNIADFDSFDLANFNRQAGAMMSTLGLPKADVLRQMVLDINPDAKVTVFPSGVNSTNMGEFLSGVHHYVDGLDFFAFRARAALFDACARMGIPATTVAPLGMGAALINFLPDQMTFEEYFRWSDLPDDEKALRFFIGLAPAGLQGSYLVDPSTIDLPNRSGPSTIMACQLCAGVAATEALKILLHRGKVYAAPYAIQYDAFRNKLARTWRPWGNAHPLQRLVLRIAKRKLLDGKQRMQTKKTYTGQPIIEQVIDLARWAPSGDNTQPWRFEIVAPTHLVVHGFDTREHCVYDLTGHPSQISIGALLENIAIAASGHGWRASFSRRTDMPDSKPTIDVRFSPDASVQPDPLIGAIPERAVQRRAMSTRPLTRAEKELMERALGPGYRIMWLESFGRRLKTAMLNSANAKIRLTIPEAYEVHRKIIQWGSRYSEDRIPDQALGLDAMTVKLMRWAMRSWGRVSFMNRFLAGTLAPRLQLDLIPGIACAAHFVLLAEREPESIDDYLAAGRALQRFWLTATRLGLCLQPGTTPLIFAGYVRRGIRFTNEPAASEQAAAIASRLNRLIGADSARLAVFMGRIGESAPPQSRSLRLPTQALMYRSETAVVPEPSHAQLVRLRAHAGS